MRRRPHYIGSSSGYKGVYFCKNLPKKPWKSYLRQHGQYICMGYFATKEEAAAAYDREAERLFGPRTYLNRDHGCRPRNKRANLARRLPRQDPKELLEYGLRLLSPRT